MGVTSRERKLKTGRTDMSFSATRVLIFNQQGREDVEYLLKTFYEAYSSRTTLRFAQAVFCTNVTFGSGKYSKGKYCLLGLSMLWSLMNLSLLH